MVRIVKGIVCFSIKRNIAPCSQICDMNGCKAVTVREGIVFYSCHAIWNVDRGKSVTATAFVSCCVSVTYALNSRKVMTWIL